MTDHLKKANMVSGEFSSRKVSENGHFQDNSNLLPFPGRSGKSNESSFKKSSEMVSFDRRELDQLLNIYGFRVGAGEWRDYAIDMLKDRAVFSVFQRQGDVPVYQIEKNPKLARKQGAYSIVNAAGQVLKRGHDLAVVLKYFDKKPGLRTV